MSAIFLSYRTDGDGFAAAAIYSRLITRFGTHQVFRDRESISPGTVYPKRILTALTSCTVLVAIIGPRWLDAGEQSGGRRIDNPRDWVRTELRVAFRRTIPVVPVLLDNTQLPPSANLPPDIATLALSQACQIRNHCLDADTDRLIEHLAAHVTPATTTPSRNGQTVQTNRADGGGTLYAAQNGNIIIHAPRG